MNEAQFKPEQEENLAEVSPKKLYNLSKYLKPALLVILIIILILIALLGLDVILNFSKFKTIYGLAMTGKNDLETAQHKIINREFEEGLTYIEQSHDNFNQAKALWNDSFLFSRYYPYLRTQIKAADQIFIIGDSLTSAMQKLGVLGVDITKGLPNESLHFFEITTAQKRDMLQKFMDSEDILIEAKSEIDIAYQALENIPQKGLLGPVNDAIEPLKENLPQVKTILDDTIPMVKVIPRVAGYPTPKKYMFLLQNNHEIRATGGFIGTIGVLELENGEIKTFKTDNVYKFDEPTKELLDTTPPYPIDKYMQIHKWFLRDGNWYVDFPTSAQKVEELYKKEVEILKTLDEDSETVVLEDFDGIVAITPEFIKGVLEITGPVVAESRLFTADNFMDELEFVVGIQYREQGISDDERKAIINTLSNNLQAVLFKLPYHRLAEILELAQESLNEKNILLYDHNPELQQLILERNWGGAVKQTDNDYLVVVDTNLASLKTDRVMDRTINYSLNTTDNGLVGRVEVEYKNNGYFDWRTTRYRTYTRVYVPKGSELISSSGVMENDKLLDPNRTPGKVDVYEESGKTVFGAFISTEPGEVGKLVFEYTLPARIAEQISAGDYNLTVQKQPGVYPNLNLDLSFNKNINTASPAEEEQSWFDKQYNYSSELRDDQEFKINLK